MKRPTWGDSVRVRSQAASAQRPGAWAAVCGIRQVENDEQSREFCRPVGATVLLVEFTDGSAIEIPEDLVELE